MYVTRLCQLNYSVCSVITRSLGSGRWSLGSGQMQLCIELFCWELVDCDALHLTIKLSALRDILAHGWLPVLNNMLICSQIMLDMVPLLSHSFWLYLMSFCMDSGGMPNKQYQNTFTHIHCIDWRDGWNIEKSSFLGCSRDFTHDLTEWQTLNR